jgi:hypothetical protein
LILKVQEKGPKIPEQLDVLTKKKIIENELEVFKSRTLMEEVLRHFHVPALFNDAKVSRTAAYVTSAVLAGADIKSASIPAFYLKVLQTNKKACLLKRV